MTPTRCHPTATVAMLRSGPHLLRFPTSPPSTPPPPPPPPLHFCSGLFNTVTVIDWLLRGYGGTCGWLTYCAALTVERVCGGDTPGRTPLYWTVYGWLIVAVCRNPRQWRDISYRAMNPNSARTDCIDTANITHPIPQPKPVTPLPRPTPTHATIISVPGPLTTFYVCVTHDYTTVRMYSDDTCSTATYDNYYVTGLLRLRYGTPYRCPQWTRAYARYVPERGRDPVVTRCLLNGWTWN